MDTNLLILVLVLFQLKHFVADFPLLQTAYMAMGKGKPGLSFILPLASHCLVHTFLSLLIIVPLRPEVAWIAIVEFIAHFLIDRMKSTYKLPAGQWTVEEKGKYLSKYYLAFGMDQLAHNLCYSAMIYVIFSH